MATKMKMMKFLQEVRGMADIADPGHLPKPTALYLAQLQSHMRTARRPKRRFIIPITLQNATDIPNPVKITFLAPIATEIQPAPIPAG
jgi:hypothetical protein